MQWQIEHFLFCSKQQTLTEQDSVQQLEPMVVELLHYFCQHPNQIISRDQLIESVWLGRVITDNAVNRVITKCRKHLADDPKQPKFIATFPKKGYKFIATVKPLVVASEAPITAITASTATQAIEIDVPSQRADTAIAPNLPDQQQASNTTIKRRLLTISAFALAFLSLYLLMLAVNTFLLPKLLPSLLPNPIQKQQQVLTKVNALTRGVGMESFPQISPDGSRMLYTEIIDNKMHLRLKQLANGQQTEIHVTADDRTWAGPAAWRDDGKKLVYLVTSRTSCQYFIADVDQLTVSNETLIHTCPTGSAGKIIFTHDNQQLIYAEATGANAPYSLYLLNLATNSTHRLAQPPLVLGGNNQFDLHPVQQKLLISSPDLQQWEGFYALDLTTNQLSLLFKQDAYICCGIWDHSGTRIVLLGDHPAYQLVSYNLAGTEQQLLYSGSQQLSLPTRHTNGKDYLFVAGNVNEDINLLNLADHSQTSIANSSVDDRLASFAHHTGQIAYISLASGTEELWLTKIADGLRQSPTRLTQFNDSRHYIDLRWSPDDKHLLALTFNELHLIDAQTGEFQRLNLSQTEIRAISFKDNNTIAFSTYNGANWSVRYYQLDNQQLSDAQQQWQFVHYANTPQDTLWLNQQNQLFQGPEQALRLVSNPKIAQADFLFGRHFNLQKQGHNWYWLERSIDKSADKYVLMRFNERSQNSEQLAISDSGYFAVNHQQVLLSVIASTNTDIYQTVQ